LVPGFGCGVVERIVMVLSYCGVVVRIVMVLSYCGVFSIYSSVSSVWGIFSYYTLSVGVCYRAGVWMDVSATGLVCGWMCLLQGWCVDGSCCRIAELCEDKENTWCQVV
jgi:hypothetical protein